MQFFLNKVKFMANNRRNIIFTWISVSLFKDASNISSKEMFFL